MAGAPDATSPIEFYEKSPAKRPKRFPTKAVK
jgi:hypothetical protein